MQKGQISTFFPKNEFSATFNIHHLLASLFNWRNKIVSKTRSGKIMRRVLRKIAEDQPDQLGDVSTLADPGVVDSLLRERHRPGT